MYPDSFICQSRISKCVFAGILLLGFRAHSYAQSEAVKPEYEQKQEALNSLQSYLDKEQLGKLHGALARAQRGQNKTAIADAYLDLAEQYNHMNQLQPSLESLDQAAALYSSVKNAKAQAAVQHDIGATLNLLGRRQQSILALNKALILERSAGALAYEAKTLTLLVSLYKQQHDEDRVITSYKNLITVAQRMSDGPATGDAYNELAEFLAFQNHASDAIETWKQAIPYYEQNEDHASEAKIYAYIGLAYWALRDFQPALDATYQALSIYQSIDLKDGLAAMHNTLGLIDGDLGDFTDALNEFSAALVLTKALDKRQQSELTLNNIGMVYADVPDRAKALDFYQQALDIAIQLQDKGDQARTLTNMGELYLNSDDLANAELYLKRALQTWSPKGDESGRPMTLILLARLSERRGDRTTAHAYLDQALPVVIRLADPLTEAMIFHTLMLSESERNPDAAIFYGKHSINLLQHVRGNIGGLSSSTRNQFFIRRSDYYHDLSDLLVKRGRLAEAVQLLNLLKEQEFSDFTRGSLRSSVDPMPMLSRERQAERDLQLISSRILASSQRGSEVERLLSSTVAVGPQLQSRSLQQAPQKQTLEAFFARVNTSFQSAPERDPVVPGSVAVLKNELASTPGAVALYTSIEATQFTIVGITADQTFVTHVPISETALNSKIVNFINALEDPSSDVKPSAKELYDVIVTPVKASLDQSKARSLIWFVDGALRYVPMAALYDGEKYLVETYSSVNLTPASLPTLRDSPDLNALRVAAMGLSRQYEKDLPALPEVETELYRIVKSKDHSLPPDESGLLPGSILLNDEFTESGMVQQLKGQHLAVHIASHFVFSPGEDDKSYLLLAGKERSGNGYHLTIRSLVKDDRIDFRGTDLVTFSACESGLSAMARGREIDGLAMAAQRKGARAVLSSLWETNDTSTGTLMVAFYRRWVTGDARLTKAEALREAELDLLQDRNQEPLQESGARSQFTHPYYWASFVLTGNWR